MLVEHRGRGSRIDASAWVAPNAVLSGDVVVGPSARVLYGAVGGNCVIMEQAVLRAAARWPAAPCRSCPWYHDWRSMRFKNCALIAEWESAALQRVGGLAESRQLREAP